MTLQATLVGTDAADNPSRLQVLVTFIGNYGVNGVGDLLNLAPYAAGLNPTGMLNPNNLPLPALPGGGLEIAPMVQAENLGGYYIQPNPLVAPAASEGVAGSIIMLTGVHLRVFAPGGAELATNAGYAADGLTAAGIGALLEVILPKDQ